MTKGTDYYTLLDLARGASPEDVRRAYRDAARRLHPDFNQYPGETEMFLRVKEAYEVLSDPTRRSEYDSQLTQAPPPPLNLSILYSRTVLPLLPESQLIYALLEFKPPGEDPWGGKTAVSPPLNVALVLDRSTSMQGERMDLLKGAAIELVRQLRPQDVLSIVAFGDRAETILPARKHHNPRDIENVIHMIQTGGATEILHGLEAGFQEVQRGLSPNHVNHVLLLTDGNTYGDEHTCLEVADKMGALGIGITALGLGEAWNDVFLDELASRSGGSSVYISRPKELIQFFNQLYQRLSHVYADRIQLQLNLQPGMTLLDAYRLGGEPARLPVEMPIRLGTIRAQDSLSVLLELQAPSLATPDPRLLLASGEVSFALPSEPNTVYQRAITLTRPVGSGPLAESAPEPVLQAVSQVTLFRLQERARQEAHDGASEKAARRLMHLATHLLYQGERELAHTVLFEAENLQHTQAFSGTGEKQLKYGTRSLLLQSRILGREL